MGAKISDTERDTVFSIGLVPDWLAMVNSDPLPC